MIEALFPTADQFAAWLAEQEPANQVADSDTFERGGHMVTVNRGAGGRFGRGSRLGDTMHAIAGVGDDDEADYVEFDGGEKIFNWATRLPDGAYQLDIEDNTEPEPDPDADPDDEEEIDDYRGFARLRMSPSDMKRFAAGLSASILIHQMTNGSPLEDNPNRPLIASLLASTPMNVKFDNEWSGQSLDWGTLNQDGSVRLLAVDDDGDEASMRLTLPELRRLHAQLVRQNMEEDDNPYLSRPQAAAVEFIERDGHSIAVNRGAKGRFSKISAVAQALQESGNAADSLSGFDRPALMREAKRRELAVPRGASADAVRALILDSAREAPTAPSAPADLQRAALTKLNVPALKARAAADGHSFTSKTKKPDLIDMIMSGPRNPDAPERVVADRGAGQSGRLSAGELPAANAEIDAMVADPQPWARDRMNNILGRMTIAQLQDVAGRHNATLDTTVSTKAMKAKRLTERLVGHKLDSASIERVIMGDGDRARAERTAIDRQAAIDVAQSKAAFLADLEEALGNDTDIEALRRMTSQSLRRNRLSGDPQAEALTSLVATTFDPAEIRRATGAATKAQGMRRLDVGDDTFDPAKHIAIGKIAPGAPIELVRPGYMANINGEEVRLTKPTVIADATPDPDIAQARHRLQAAQGAEAAAGDPDSRAANRARQAQNQARAELARLGAPEKEPEPRDRSVRRRASRRTAGDSPLRGLSGSDLTAALENVTADDEQNVRAGLEGRDLAELVQIARDVPTVGMPPRQNRTALVDAIVRGTVGFRANARAMRSPGLADVDLFAGDRPTGGLTPAMRTALQQRASNGLVEGSPQTLAALERLGMVQRSDSGFYRATPHGIKSAGPAPDAPPSADDMSRAVGQGLTGMMQQEAAGQDIARALARYRAEGDANAAALAEKIAANHRRGLYTPEDVIEVLADLEANRGVPAAQPAIARPSGPLTSPANAHSLKRGDQFVSGTGEVLTVVLHRQTKNAEGQPVVLLEARGRDGETRQLELGLNQPVDRLIGVSGGGAGTFAIAEQVHEEFCLTPLHKGPCVGWKDALPDDDPRKKRRAKAPTAPKRRRAAAAAAPAGAMTAADIAALPDDQLFDLFAQLSKQDTLDEPLMRRLIDDMDRRERQTPVPALEDADLTPEQRRVDELVAGGRDYLSAYTEVHGGSEQGTGAAAVDRRPGERLDQAVRRSYDEFTHLNYLQAEKATRGHMLNKAGQAAGIDPLTLFTGPVSRARRYASEDLTRWWARNGRMNLAQFRAQVLGGQKDKAAAAKTRQQSNSRDFI